MSGAVRSALCAAVLILGGIAAPAGRAQSVLDDLGNRLTFVSADGGRWVRLSAVTDLAVYQADEPVPGLLFSDTSPLLAPRLSVSADGGIGERLLAHARIRADRGFDPGAETDGDVRVDEYFLQADFFDAARGRLRVGKFATAFGGWVSRHLAWDNPLITAPLLYEDMVTITDAAAPADPAAFLARRDVAENKPAWVPVVWGPSYATGAALSLAAGDVELVVEAKNGALSARPETWDEWDRDTDPTVTGRIGWHPRPEWHLGVSFSEGPYLQDEAADTLPPGADLEDFQQRTVGLDLTYERHRLQLWAELAASRFDVPRVGAADMVGGFVEVRYKLATRWWVAGRWNQSWFDDVAGPGGDWDRDLRRADVAVGFRHSAHVQGKLEYSEGDQQGRDTGGHRLVAAQIVVWF